MRAIERLEAQRSAPGRARGRPCAGARSCARSTDARRGSLADLPDPAALGQRDRRRRAERLPSPAQAVADKRAEAATRARETAADRERHAAPRGASRKRLASARRPKPKRGSRKPVSGPVAQAAEREEIAQASRSADAAEIVSIEQASAASRGRDWRQRTRPSGRPQRVGRRWPSIVQRGEERSPRPASPAPGPPRAPKRSRARAPNMRGFASSGSNASPPATARADGV